MAEGIETAAQLRALEAMGCDLAQGFLVSHPLPSEACIAVIREQQQVPGTLTAHRSIQGERGAAENETPPIRIAAV